MAGQRGFWSVEGRLAERSAPGDPLETLAATVAATVDATVDATVAATVDVERLRPVLAQALGEAPRWKGGPASTRC